MREILFRGKRADNGEWVFGNFIEDKWGDDNGNTVYAILQDRVAPDIAVLWTPVKVIPETVGQFTGLCDKNGTKIFEGDIIECDVFGATVTVEHRKYLVVFENGTYVGQWSIGEHKFSTYMHETWRRNVVGNKWDNSELLEVMR